MLETNILTIEPTKNITQFSKLMLTFEKLYHGFLLYSLTSHSFVNSGLEILIENSRTNDLCVLVNLGSVMKLLLIPAHPILPCQTYPVRMNHVLSRQERGRGNQIHTHFIIVYCIVYCNNVLLLVIVGSSKLCA